MPIHEIKEKLEEIAKCDSQQELDTLVAQSKEQFEAGHNKVSISLKDKDDFFKKMCHHWIIGRQICEIQSYQEGLSSSGILDF